MPELSLQQSRHVSIAEVLDRVINKGAVISGEITISVADIDLIQLALQLVIASSGTLLRLENTAGSLDHRSIAGPGPGDPGQEDNDEPV